MTTPGLTDDPLGNVVMINTGTVEFKNFMALRACVTGLKCHMPLMITIETNLRMETPAFAMNVWVNHEINAHTKEDFVSVKVETELGEFDSWGIQYDTSAEELRGEDTDGRYWMFCNAVHVRMRNVFREFQTTYSIRFSDLVDAARKKRYKQALALLMGTHARNAPCAVKRFAQHELSERQLFLVIKTFL